MKTRTIYICDFCKSEHKNPNDAYECEAKHLGLTVEQYNEYNNLLNEERKAFAALSCSRNEQTLKRCDEIVGAVIAFQQKYGFEDSR